MSKFFLILSFIFFYLNSKSQTIIYNDNCEATGYNWLGYPVSNLNSGYVVGTTGGADRPTSANLYTSSSTGFGNYGYGNATSAYETEIYQLPNVTGLDNTKTYRFRFRIMAYAQNFNSFVASGLDIDDYVEVRISTNNGTSYTTESRITGFSNCYWSFSSTGVINETANNALNTYSPTAGGNRETTGDGYSTYNLTLTNITQLSVRIFMRANYGGLTQGEWWVIDDMELWDMTPTPLPVELISLQAENIDGVNVVSWYTASENNSDYFSVQKSIDGTFEEGYETKVQAAGNSNVIQSYRIKDYDFEKCINYYRLLQYDRDGKFVIYGPVAIDNRQAEKKVVKITDILGREVDENYKGLVILIYSDGTSKKIYR